MEGRRGREERSQKQGLGGAQEEWMLIFSCLPVTVLQRPSLHLVHTLAQKGRRRDASPVQPLSLNNMLEYPAWLSTSVHVEPPHSFLSSIILQILAISSPRACPILQPHQQVRVLAPLCLTHRTLPLTGQGTYATWDGTCGHSVRGFILFTYLFTYSLFISYSFLYLLTSSGLYFLIFFN